VRQGLKLRNSVLGVIEVTGFERTPILIGVYACSLLRAFGSERTLIQAGVHIRKLLLEIAFRRRVFYLLRLFKLSFCLVKGIQLSLGKFSPHIKFLHNFIRGRWCLPCRLRFLNHFAVRELLAVKVHL